MYKSLYFKPIFADKNGKLKYHLVKIHIDSNVNHVRHNRRQTLIHFRADIEKAIKQKLKDKIEPVDGPPFQNYKVSKLKLINPI